MKQAVTMLAVFLYITTAAQQTDFPIKNELPVYKPVRFDLHKNLKTGDQHYRNTNFLLIKKTVPETSLKTLLDNLADDKQFFQLEQKKTQWTEFSSGILNSYSRQMWFENKNTAQQRWMAQKVKGK